MTVGCIQLARAKNQFRVQPMATAATADWESPIANVLSAEPSTHVVTMIVDAGSVSLAPAWVTATSVYSLHVPVDWPMLRDVGAVASPKHWQFDTGSSLVGEGSSARVGNVAEAIQRLEQRSVAPIADVVAKRLRELLVQYRDETDGRDYLTSSVVGLTAFLAALPSAKRPALSVTDGGTLYARWKLDLQNIFSVHFASADLVDYVLISPHTLGGVPRTGRGSPEVVAMVAKEQKLQWVVA